MLWHCTACTTAYPVGLVACPHCGSRDYSENPMPKITVSRGATYAGHVDVTPADVTEPDWQPAPVQPVAEPEPKPAPRTRTRKRV